MREEIMMEEVLFSEETSIEPLGGLGTACGMGCGGGACGGGSGGLGCAGGSFGAACGGGCGGGICGGGAAPVFRRSTMKVPTF